MIFKPKVLLQIDKGKSKTLNVILKGILLIYGITMIYRAVVYDFNQSILLLICSYSFIAWMQWDADRYLKKNNPVEWYYLKKKDNKR